MYKLTDNQAFVIENFQQAKTFSSFLPGIAGKAGIPIWAFYVNRGQVMGGFGIQDKNNAIAEFFPADKSYQIVPVQGFRTFIKTGHADVFEPFSFTRDNQSVNESLTIGANHIQLDYTNEARGLALTVEYYTLPNSPIGALVREVTVKNISDQSIDIEIIDGLAAMLPSGIDNMPYKELGNTLKSWFDVDVIDEKFNFYYLRGSTADEANVSEVHDGNFYASLVATGGKEIIVKPIYDRDLIFGADMTMQTAHGLTASSVTSLSEEHQVATNKVSAGFTPVKTTLAAGSDVKIYSVIGYGKSRETVKAFVNNSMTAEQFAAFKQVAKAMSEQLTRAVKTNTAEPLFDAYAEQNYLDNGLRGGFPVVFENEKDSKIFYLYSRKHGDLERDYNFFSISPTYYSQGNGNYRDMNQNRRLDVLFEPKVKDYNIRQFVNLIQLDGYNPLSVKKVRYQLDNTQVNFADYGLAEDEVEKLVQFFEATYAPGELMRLLEEENIQLSVAFEDFLTDMLAASDESLEAEHGEGFWIDHWTYNLDLIDSYLAVYPDCLHELFFVHPYRFFDSPAYVAPRATKYVDNNGVLRQYHAVGTDKDKQERQQKNNEQWLRGGNGLGDIFETNLFSKLFLLAVNKLSSIAPYGLGIEMEAGKPGWNDALNGLPGMFGASTSELYELKRLIKQLQEVATATNERVILPEETAPFVADVAMAIAEFDYTNSTEAMDYWNAVTSLKEAYRASIRDGINGDSYEISVPEAKELLSMFTVRVDAALEAVETYKEQDLVPTYFYFEAKARVDAPDEIEAFTPHAVTPFLEGVVKKLKLTDSVEEAEGIYQAVRASEIYDEKLGMYKTSTSIVNEPVELGRAKSFTPGWLENESVFMHMEYKYLLELLRKGLPDKFFADIKTALVPFLDAATYGRSILENSSFIASSANPNPDIHGRGYVARLTGSTVEFLHMWLTMFVGIQPFSYDNDNERLAFKLEPILPSWLFKTDDTASFTLFKDIHVIYVNSARKDTFGENGVKPISYKICYRHGSEQVVDGAIVYGDIAAAIRDCQVATIEVELG